MGIGIPQRSFQPLGKKLVQLAAGGGKALIITLSCDHAFVFKITFIAHQYNGEVITFLLAFDSQNLSV